MTIKKTKINGQFEYRETILHSCKHTIEYTTYGYKMERRQAAMKRSTHCPRCQLLMLMGNG